MKLTRPVELRGYEGSGMGGFERRLKRVCKGAAVERGLSITGNRAAQSRDEVASWAKRFAYRSSRAAIQAIRLRGLCRPSPTLDCLELGEKGRHRYGRVLVGRCPGIELRERGVCRGLPGRVVREEDVALHVLAPGHRVGHVAKRDERHAIDPHAAMRCRANKDEPADRPAANSRYAMRLPPMSTYELPVLRYDTTPPRCAAASCPASGRTSRARGRRSPGRGRTCRRSIRQAAARRGRAPRRARAACHPRAQR